MAYSVSGQLVDGKGTPIEFAIVYTSDASGKPIVGSKNAQTDEKGKWVLSGVNDSDYITASIVGYNKKIIPAKSIVPVNIMGLPMRAIQMKLTEDVKTILPEAEIASIKVPLQKEKKLGKYIAIASIGIILISATVLILNKKLI